LYLVAIRPQAEIKKVHNSDRKKKGEKWIGRVTCATELSILQRGNETKKKDSNGVTGGGGTGVGGETSSGRFSERLPLIGLP